MNDSDGHSLAYSPDSQYRVNGTATWNGSAWIEAWLQYDTDNSVASAWDGRGNRSDFAYDPTLRFGRPTGNLIAAVGPPVAAYNGAILGFATLRIYDTVFCCVTEKGFKIGILE